MTKIGAYYDNENNENNENKTKQKTMKSIIQLNLANVVVEFVSLWNQIHERLLIAMNIHRYHSFHTFHQFLILSGIRLLSMLHQYAIRARRISEITACRYHVSILICSIPV